MSDKVGKENWKLLVALLRNDTELGVIAPQRWEDVLSFARRGRLAARLGSVLGNVPNTANFVPPAVNCLLDASLLGASRLSDQMRYEIGCLAASLRRLGQRCVVLKGAAYLCADLPPAKGRLFGDIDLLVPESELDAVERGLLAFGWMESPSTGYDQRYYRTWMHELPPMTHLQTGTVLDVHHAITPRTSCSYVPGERMLAHAVPIDEARNLWMLQPVDMVLHSAVHLMSEGEFDHGVRDLLDLLDLLRHFGQHEQDFWTGLLDRADELRLHRPLHHVLTQINLLFGNCVPAAVQGRVDAMAPPRWQVWAMSALFTQVLRPNHPNCDGAWTGLARWLMYVRSHALRMPLRLLVPHLMRKAWMSHFRSGSKLAQARPAHAHEPPAADPPQS